MCKKQQVSMGRTYALTDSTCRTVQMYCQIQFHSMLIQFLLQIVYNSGTFIVLCYTFTGAWMAQSV
jgi:hypothetical protein